MTKNSLPVIKGTQTEWVIGWKATTAYLNDHGKLVFMPLIIRNMQYGVEDVAECYQYGHTKPPYEMCKCGFNAWHDISQAISYMEPFARHRDTRANVAYTDWGSGKSTIIAHNFTMVILRVGLYGDVIDATEPAWGYRAQRQSVADVFFNHLCARCDKKATTLALMDAEYPLPQWLAPEKLQSRLIWQLCDDHIDIAVRILDVSELAKSNNVKIHQKYPAPN